ncbi:MAG: beta-galactosidase, partial [Lentisphaeria bacterium]|nr:beta-galactosidase [Lentisphaeria bacterium]
EASVRLQLGEARVLWQGMEADDELVPVHIEPRRTGITSAAVAPLRGVPALTIDGKPHNGMVYTAYGPSTQVFAEFARAGVTLFSICGTPTESGYGLSRTSWTAPDVYDFSQLDERVMMVLGAAPEARIFPRLYLHAPKWWSDQHPDDLVLADPGDGNPKLFLHSGGKPAPSWASQAWRQDTIRGLERLIEHVRTSPYADRIIGYHLASGTTEEWMMWGANENEWVDYSPVNAAAFRNWLRRRYGQEERLRRAWNDPRVTFGNARVPTRQQRAASALGALRDPDKEQPVIDFTLYNSDLVAETIATFAAAVKEMTGRTKLVGVFYGYLLQLCGEQRQQNAGHLALERVLACPDVDFLSSPTSYAFRQLGGKGTSHFMSLTDSVKRHGKLWFDENDIRTSLSPGDVGGWGKPENLAGDLLQQDKELANVLANGVAQWWFDVGRNRYDDPALMAHIAGLVAAADRAAEGHRGPVDQVALAVDESSLCHLRTGHAMGRHLLVGQLPSLHRLGAPVGHYLTADLPLLRSHRMVILPTSFAPSKRDREAVETLKNDGRVLVFLYAPGVYGAEGRFDPAAAEAFCGIRLARLADSDRPLSVTLEGDRVAGIPAGTSYGISQSVNPVFAATAGDVEVLGRLPDGSPGLVLRRFPSWTAVFSAAPLLPARAWRALAQQAGVHLYIDTPDVVWASGDVLAVCVDEPGQRVLHLPRRAEVLDLYTGERITPDGDRLPLDFAAQSTRLLRLLGE